MDVEQVRYRDQKTRYASETESLYEALVENSEDAILSMSLDNKITSLNHAAELMFDYRREEILGQSVFNLVPLGRGGDLQAKLKRVRDGERVEHYETERLRKDGLKFHVSLRLSAIKDSFGDVTGVSWILRDITEQKQKEALIRKLSSVVEQTADSVMIADKSGIVEYVNPAFVATTGYSEEEIIGRTASVLKSGKHSRLFYKEMWDTILSGRPFRSTMINKKKNGDLFYTEKTITPISVTSEALSHFVSTDKDITDRKLAEEHSKQMQRRFTELFSFATDAMAYCALDGTLMEVNDAFCRLTGYTHEELENHKTYQDITTPEGGEEGERRLKQMLKTGESCSYEKLYKKKEGDLIPTLITAFPVKNEGQSVGAIGVIVKDITELKRQQKQLEMTSAELVRSNKELEQFSSIASHDLQEPLRTIALYLQMIARNNPSFDEDTKEHLEFAIEGSIRLRNLIDDLLSYSRVGTKKANCVEVESGACFQEALGNLQEAIRVSHATVECDALPRICADPRRLTQLFQNLLGNAVKYSKESPYVKVSATRQAEGWIFKVTDQGIGIEKDSAEKIFDMFQRLHARSEVPGAGIGLAICKKIVEQRGGKIWVEPNIGIGSTFFFTVPDAPPCI